MISQLYKWLKRHYLFYLLDHKFWVLYAGRVTKAPLWRLVIHDWSKFTWAEWGPYKAQYFGRCNLGHRAKDPACGACLARRQRYDKAWLHHLHRNPHHWDHWQLEGRPLSIPVHFLREMVADWLGAGRSISGTWDADRWYNRMRDKIQLTEQDRAFVERVLVEALQKLDPQEKMPLSARGAGC